MDDDDVLTDCDLYFMADYSAFDLAGDKTPFAFVVLPKDTVLSVPPFMRVNKIAVINVTGEVISISQQGLSYEQPDPAANEIVVGYGLRLTEEDLTTQIMHPVCSAVYDATPFAEATLTRLAHNKDTRTFLYMGGQLRDVYGSALGMALDPSAVTVRDVSFVINTASGTVESQQTAVSANRYWLGVAATAPQTGDTRITLTGNTTVGVSGVFVHGGYMNQLPLRAYVMEGTILTKIFEQSQLATFYYSSGKLRSKVNVSPIELAVGVMTGYVVQYTVGAVTGTFQASAPSSPEEGTSFPSLRLTVSLAPQAYGGEHGMEFFQTFSLLGADTAWPTAEIPLPPDAIDMTHETEVAPGFGEIDLNDSAVQKSVCFPSCDNTTGRMTGVSVNLRLPQVMAPDDASLGVSYATNETTGDRETCLQGVEEAPAVSAQERVFAYSHAGDWGLFELEMLFQLDSVNKRFYYNPQKYDAGQQKVLDHTNPTDTWDFEWMSNTYNSVKIRVQTHEAVDTVNNKLVRYYRDITLPKVLVSHVSAEYAEDVILGENC